MLVLLFLLFTVVPLLELAILIRIGQVSEWWLPIVLVIVTGIAGAALARWQGWQALRRIRDEARAGRVPADALVDGFLILIAGILLVTPGVLTDLAGVVLLIPPLRSLAKRGLVAWIKRNVEVRVGRSVAALWTDVDRAASPQRDEIIEARVTGTRVEDAE